MHSYVIILIKKKKKVRTPLDANQMLPELPPAKQKSFVDQKVQQSKFR